MPVLPEAQPCNILHAGMVALLQNSLVLEHTADNANTHMKDINIGAVSRIRVFNFLQELMKVLQHTLLRF
jgi:hypothetical protein